MSEAYAPSQAKNAKLSQNRCAFQDDGADWADESHTQRGSACRGERRRHHSNRRERLLSAGKCERRCPHSEYHSVHLSMERRLPVLQRDGSRRKRPQRPSVGILAAIPRRNRPRRPRLFGLCRLLERSTGQLALAARLIAALISRCSQLMTAERSKPRVHRPQLRVLCGAL